LRKLARGKRRGQLLIAAGCLPERQEIPLATLIPQLDGVIGTRRWAEFDAFLQELRAHKRNKPRECFFWNRAALEDNAQVIASFPRLADSATAYLKINDGCDIRCAFCAIPLIKGPQRSKPSELVLQEARQLVDQGAQELVLIGQDTTAYGRDLGQQDALPELIDGLLKAAPELTWLRVLYAYPQHVSPRLIEIMEKQEQFCHYLDIPLQHSHPDVLGRMRRSPDIDRVRALVTGWRKRLPDLTLRTSFIVGYPGETEAEFEHLLNFMREMTFDKVGVFTYSPESGTPAAELPDQIPPQIKEERYDRAMLAQQEISRAQNARQIGRTLPVLIEGFGDNLNVGRCYRDAPEIDGMMLIPGAELPVGEFTQVRVTGASEYDLVGEPILSKRG
jgi:ribosomal protein S12 methylthiotransferase